MSKPNYHNEDEWEENESPKLPPQDDPLLEKIKAYILNTYEPVQIPAEADTRMTTHEIYQAMMRHYPDQDAFTENMLANWLHEKGFTFFDAGKMRFEWMLKQSN